ncbi:hypothetical protein BH10BAC5_BH10BAC5_23580 [soil metagenome]
MKTKLILSLTITFVTVLFISSIIYTYPNGITGKTRKTTTNGCGSCHGSNPTAGLSVVISGPDSLALGMSAVYTLTTTSVSGSKGGLDVATRSGTLGTNQSGTQLLNGEITHTTGKNFSGGSVSFTFNYTAPSSNTIDTIFSTGVASTGGTNGPWNWFEKRVKIYTITGVIQNNNFQPENYELKQNFPNPFNPTTSIIYLLKKSGNTELTIFNSLGEGVLKVVNSYQQIGEYKVDFNASNLASGIYFYTLKTEDFIQTKSMVLLK